MLIKAYSESPQGFTYTEHNDSYELGKRPHLNCFESGKTLINTFEKWVIGLFSVLLECERKFIPLL